MRFKSNKTGGYRIYAISGVNVISFAIDFEEADTKGLLGFAVEREEVGKNDRRYVRGFKVFKDIVPKTGEKTEISTENHPVQSFVWDDLTVNPGRKYEYYFHPLKGTPKNLDRSAKKIKIEVETEPEFTGGEHDVFFNRGAASSQAYARKFGNKPPDQLGDKQQEACDWLSRQLDDAILKFIKQAKPGETLLGCFYEFHYEPVVKAFKEALDRGVNVKLIIDCKVNEHMVKDKKTGKSELQPSFPREINLQTIQKVGFPMQHVIKREANSNNIQHNKFIVYLKGKKQVPSQVWTGSTNISEGGIFGQTNVGHWVRNEDAAAKYKAYWEVLSTDPGGSDADDTSTKGKKNKAFKKAVEIVSPDLPAVAEIPVGITPIFSPRSSLSALNTYAEMLDNAKKSSFITLAFGINDLFKQGLKNNTSEDHITFILLEKRDVKNPRSKKEFINIGAMNNVYQSWGSYLKHPLYNWARETNTDLIGYNKHVKYIHSKFLLADPLTADPIVVTGSANFSDASTRANDENMIIIRGNKRVADIYFTEFNRLFNHYYFRAISQIAKPKTAADAGTSVDGSIYLDPTDKWIKNYAKGKLRYKRVKMFKDMDL